jgi:hypothetical protein
MTSTFSIGHSEELGKMMFDSDPTSITPKKPVRKRVIFGGFILSVCLMLVMNFTEVIFATLNWDTLQCFKNSTISYRK